MASVIKSIFLLFLLFLLMVVINESMRNSFAPHNFSIYGVSPMNSGAYNLSKCTWACHDATTLHCKVHHATSASPYFKWIDPIYFGMIGGLHATGNYGIANVILLVLAWPLIMSYLFIRVWKMRKELQHG